MTLTIENASASIALDIVWSSYHVGVTILIVKELLLDH